MRWLSVQLAAIGGSQSCSHINKDNGTSYNRRDTTTIVTMDFSHTRTLRSLPLTRKVVTTRGTLDRTEVSANKIKECSGELWRSQPGQRVA